MASPATKRSRAAAASDDMSEELHDPEDDMAELQLTAKAMQRSIETQRQEIDALQKQQIPFQIDIAPWGEQTQTEFLHNYMVLRESDTVKTMLEDGLITHIQDTQFQRVTYTTCISGRTREICQQLQQSASNMSVDL